MPALKEGGTGIFGFAVLAIFKSVFRFLRQKTSVFRFWCSWRFADFPLFSIRFSVFAENANGFSDLISNAGFGFSSLASVGSKFSLI